MHFASLWSNKVVTHAFHRNHIAPPFESVPPQFAGSAHDRGAGIASTDHPLLAHIIPIRRCNLACEYCNEYDDFSKPVPTEAMFQRVDKLAALGTSVITISGGEPLLHPELDEIIRAFVNAA